MDIIVLIGSGTPAEDKLRLELTLDLYNSIQNSLILISGEDSSRLKKELQKQGILPEEILVEVSSTNLVEAILNTNAMIRDLISDGLETISIIYISTDKQLEDIKYINQYFSVEEVSLNYRSVPSSGSSVRINEEILEQLINDYI